MSILNKPANILQSPKLKTSDQWLDEAKALLSQGSFNREAQAKFESIMALLQATKTDRYGLELFNQQRDRLSSTRSLDPASRAFFSGENIPESVISESGGRLESREGRLNGRHRRVTELRDTTYAMGPAEARTYTGLNEGTGSLGGYSVPTGFWPELQIALRQADGLWAAARHILTPTGNPVNMPTAFESNLGRQVAEAVAVQQNNPTFGNVQWSDCPTWSSDEILTSIQLAQDCGVGTIVDVLRDIFTIRIKLGLGQTFTNTLLSNAHVGVTTASSSAITPAEIMSLPTKVSNAMYAYQPTSGWLMAAGTLEYVYALVGTDGLRIFRKEFDDEGYPLLLKQRVYLSPTFPAIGAGNSAMAFGDLNRFHIREVADSFTLFRYDETYMPNHQYGWQAWLRADGKLISADAGVSDFPIVLLQNHA